LDSFIADERLKTKSLLNALLLAGFLAMLVTNIMLGVSVHKAFNSKSRTFVPPLISKAFSVSDGQVDAPLPRDDRRVFGVQETQRYAR
jgi:conjugal transfer pilus assembly protein TraE